MGSCLASSAIVLLTWLYALAVISGIGFLAMRLLGLGHADRGADFTMLWLGWSSIVVILQVWHLFRPVDALSAAFLSVLGITGLSLALTRRAPYQITQPRCHWLRSAIHAAAFLLFGLWLANRSLGPTTPYDAGLYHLSTIRWTREYAIVRGLGNLHGRLAFNSSYFLFLSVLDAVPWTHGHHLGSGLMLLVVSVQLAEHLVKAAMAPGNLRGYEALGIVLAFPVVRFCFTSASSTSVDLPVFILGVVIGMRLFKVLFHPKTGSQKWSDVVPILVLSAVGISLKLSFVVFGCLASLVAVWALLASKQRATDFADPRLLLGTLAAVTVVLVPWAARGVILSGYPAYPIPRPAFDVAWRVPKAKVVNEARAVASWARKPHASPDQVLRTWSWLVPWLVRLFTTSVFDVVVPVLLVIGAALHAVGSGPREKDPSAGHAAQFLMVPLVSLVFWFFAAPAVRFAGASFWLLGGGAVALRVRYHRARLRKALSHLLLILVALTLGAKAISKGVHILEGYHLTSISTPSVETYEYVTDSGLKVRVPKTGDQCWNSPLPCTPYPDPDLRLLERGELSSGFTLRTR